MIEDPKILGADGEPATPPEPDPPVRLKQTEREPLSVIQDRLRKETAAGLSGGRVRRGRQM